MENNKRKGQQEEGEPSEERNQIAKHLNSHSGEKSDALTGHVERITAGKLATIAEIQTHQRQRTRGRPQLRWGDWVRRDMEQ